MVPFGSWGTVGAALNYCINNYVYNSVLIQESFRNLASSSDCVKNPIRDQSSSYQTEQESEFKDDYTTSMPQLQQSQRKLCPL